MGETQIQTVVECYETQIHGFQNESSSKKVLYFISFIYFPSDCPQSDECFILFHLFIFHLIVPNQMNALFYISFIYFPSDCPQSDKCPPPPLIDFPKSTCSSDCPQSDVTPELIFPNQLFIWLSLNQRCNPRIDFPQSILPLIVLNQK